MICGLTKTKFKLLNIQPPLVRQKIMSRPKFGGMPKILRQLNKWLRRSRTRRAQNRRTGALPHQADPTRVDRSRGDGKGRRSHLSAQVPLLAGVPAHRRRDRGAAMKPKKNDARFGPGAPSNTTSYARKFSTPTTAKQCRGFVTPALSVRRRCSAKQWRSWRSNHPPASVY